MTDWPQPTVPTPEFALGLYVKIRVLQALRLAPDSGLEALRFRRRFQLPESVLPVQLGPCEHQAMVSEAFALSFEEAFLRDATPEVIIRSDAVPRFLSLLLPGDLRMLTSTECTFDMPHSRIRLLWQQLRYPERQPVEDGVGATGRVLRIPTEEVHTAELETEQR